MRKGEKARIMVKPAFGYANDKFLDQLEYPEGFQEGPGKVEIMNRRAFFDVKLIEWTVKHDILGDGNIMKTILKRGTGYDRPRNFEELEIDLLVYAEGQKESPFVNLQKKSLSMTDDLITPVVRKILNSMKPDEVAEAVVLREYVENIDPDFKTRHPDFESDKKLCVDINLLKMQRVDDLYYDQSVFVRSLRPGQGSASPFNDCSVTLKVKIQIDGKEEFCHKDPLATDGDSAFYDLEKYTLPSCVRKALKTAKVYEVVELRIAKTDKIKRRLADHSNDVENQIFLLEKLLNFDKEVRITFSILEIHQKEYIFKVNAVEKKERVLFLKENAARLFKEGVLEKAEKLYQKIHKYFKSKDAKGNFLKEDENTTEYRDLMDELDKLCA